MPTLHRLGLVLAFLTGPISSALGQVIRGVVTERGSGTPLAGALVTLHVAGRPMNAGSDLRNAVTNQLGSYAITAPGEATYLLTVRRIGVRAYVSEPLAIRAGETVVRNVELDPFSSLPRVTVADRSLCTTGRDGLRVASLWREAETALTVIVVSSQDSALQRRLVRFTPSTPSNSGPTKTRSRQFAPRLPSEVWPRQEDLRWEL